MRIRRPGLSPVRICVKTIKYFPQLERHHASDMPHKIMKHTIHFCEKHKHPFRDSATTLAEKLFASSIVDAAGEAGFGENHFSCWRYRSLRAHMYKMYLKPSLINL